MLEDLASEFGLRVQVDSAAMLLQQTAIVLHLTRSSRQMLQACAADIHSRDFRSCLIICIAGNLY